MQPSISEITETNQRVYTGAIFVLLAALGFSAKAVLIKLAYAYGSQVDAITLMTLRMSMALPLFLLVAFWNGRKGTGQALRALDWLKILGLGVMGYYLASYLDFSGLQLISAGLERLILFLYPTFVVLFSAVIYRRFINRRELIALGLSYAGMVMVFIENMTVDSPRLFLGSAFVLASAVTFACFMLGSGIMIRRIGSARFTAYSMSVACAATGVHFILAHGFQPLSLPANVYWLALMMAVFSTVMPAFLMNAGIRRIGADTASIISSAGPVATLLLAFVFLGEGITIAQIMGTVLVLIGVFVVSRARS